MAYDLTAQPPLLRVYRVAKILDVSKKRVYQMVHEGKLNAIRLGPRSMRIETASIVQFIESGKCRNIELLTDAGLYKGPYPADAAPAPSQRPQKRF